jgi:hypothetical protein
MEAFTIEIAGLVTQVQPLFGSTREYCRAYLTDGVPVCFVDVTPQDLVHTQAMLEKEAIEEGIRVRKFPEPFLERATIQRKIAAFLLKQDTILLHGSTVGLDGQAYLFTAPCGTGKSTHTRFWRETFGDRAVMINDDKPFLKITSSGVVAYGSPWSGKHGLDTNISLPLKGICFLRRGSVNSIRQVNPEGLIDVLLQQTFMPEDAADQEKAVALVNSLAQTVPLWDMECTKDVGAALISYQAMSGAV